MSLQEIGDTSFSGKDGENRSWISKNEFLTKDDKFQGFMSKIFEVAKVIEEARVKVKTHGKGEEEKWQAVIDGYELQNQEIQKYLAEVIARLDEDAQRKNLSTDRAVYSKVINKCFEKQIAKQTFSLDEKLQAKVIFNNALAKFDLLEGIEQR